ncbi:MAG: thiamine phosphate synthase [bacterium]
MKNYLLEKFKLSLYIILDPHFIGKRSLLTTCREIIKGGATIVQYRDKTAEEDLFLKNASLIHDVTKDNDIPLIINDRVKVARQIDAEGVHLGATDLSISQARKMFGEKKIIGFSVHNMEEFNHSHKADYLGIGSIYPTETKQNVKVCGLQFLKTIREKTKKPLIGIGGINTSNFIHVISHGADGVALISSVYSSNDIVTKVKEFSEVLNKRRFADG